ncbi:phosphopantothenoylcysteine decarboxylase domain-containing protein, partial [Terribacillus saccharophilus]|uniref:phosphopantothenoylcysteine decarboxylase domain-containing protein n=1 Tax=Terribacillus saccharophilus TaxID=361277 RepID=UPI002989F394
WLNPTTQRNVALLREHGHTVMEPATGRLTGTSGPGRLPEPQDIVDAALALAARTAPSSAGPSDAASTGSASTPDAAPSTVAAAPAGAPTTDHVGSDPGVLAGRRVLVTAGGTREALDPVRFLGNRSSGKQGVALARAAREAGAD